NPVFGCRTERNSNRGWKSCADYTSRSCSAWPTGWRSLCRPSLAPSRFTTPGKPPRGMTRHMTEALHQWVVWQMRVLFGDPIPKQGMGRFFDQLALLLHAGRSIPESIVLASRTGGLELQHICNAAARPVSAGVPLYRALTPWKDRLPEIMLPVLEVGE